jgi:cyclase
MQEIAEGVFAKTDFEGVNVGAIIAGNDLFCIDSPSYPSDARRWSASLRAIHPRRPKFLFLTDCNGDRVLNARWMNAPIIAHQKAAEMLDGLKRRYPQPWIDSLIVRNSAAGRELSSRPIDFASMSFSKEVRILVGELTIVLRHEPGPTPSSTWIWIPERRILFTGDSLVAETHPLVAEMNSKDWIASLERLSILAQDLDVIVPGRGPLREAYPTDAIIKYLKHIRIAVQNHIDAGKMLESLSDYVDDFVYYFPLEDLPVNWIRRQIAQGLESVYQELITGTYLESSVLDYT